MTRTALGWGSAVLLSGLATPGCGGPMGRDGQAPATEAGASTADAGSSGRDASTTPDAGAANDGTPGDEPEAGLDSGSEAASPSGDGGAPPISSDGGTDYGVDGPVAYTMTTFSVTTSYDSFTLNAWIPTPSGVHPVISFSPGLAQPSTGYFIYATRLASWGFVVLMRDDPGLLTSGDTIAADISTTIATWLPSQNTTTGSALFGKADLGHVGLAGHSRGGQATLDAAETGLLGKVQAWVGLDPVNTAYVAGTAPSTDLPSIGIPTTYLGAGVATNCAPAGDDYETLYAVSPSPSIALTVENASHSQFEDLSGCSACGLICSPLGTANDQTVLDLARKYLTAFFARELLGDSSVGAQLQGEGTAADEAAGLIAIVSK